MTLNDNVLYTPAPLFQDYQLEDRNLAECVQQTIEDKNITKAQQLNSLSCSYAGINSLVGLDQFPDIKELQLANNHIRNIETLGLLIRLEKISLANNQLISVHTLTELGHLKSLDLSGNTQINCDEINRLRATMKTTKAGILKRPAHCDK
jgi:Leucine-rich repeat (LRR) protein